MHQINKHTIGFELPDLVRVIVGGPISPEEMAQMGRCVLRWTKGLPHVLVIADISAFSHEGTGGESRRVAAEIARAVNYRGSAFYGGHGIQRMVANAIMRAANLFTRRDNPVRMFDTEQEARAWIEERRRILQAELAGARGQKE